MSKQIRRKYKLVIVLAAIVVAGLALIRPLAWRSMAADLSHMAVDFDELVRDDDQFIYLSDVDPVRANVGYGTFLRDQASDGSKISLKHDGGTAVFDKGLWAHASSNLYYDLEAIGAREKGYDYFTAYVGLNTTSTAGNGVRFWVYGSNEESVAQGQCLTGSQYWDVLYNAENEVMLPGQEADYVRIDVSEYRFIRLQVDANGSNGQDHSVWADAKMAKEEYEPYVVDTLEEIDAELKKIDLNVSESDEHELMVLRRDLMKNVGQYTMTQFILESAENRETLEWLYNNLDVLRMYTTGGKPSGTYLQSLKVLNELYQEFKNTDLKDNQPMFEYPGRKRKELYQRMIIALSLTHSQQVRFWIRDTGAIAGSADSPNISRPLDRYWVYKRMYLVEGKLNRKVFENLEVEEMRYVMATETGDDEIEWMRDWLPTVNKGAYTYPPLPYVSIGNHYWYAQNYPTDPAEQQVLIDKYKLQGSAYDGSGDKTISGNYLIGFEANAPHLWMIHHYGGVCWQISNFGQNMQAAYGLPSTTVGQPGHVAYMNYSQNVDGVGQWALTNDVSGWAMTNFTGYTNIQTYHQVRQLNNWGATGSTYGLMNGKRYAYQGSYIPMAQAALNQFDKYEDSQILVRTADIYGDDLVKQAQIYEQALEKLDMNFDAWYGLIANYVAQAKTGAINGNTNIYEEWFALAKKLAENMKRYPVPVYDLLRTIIAQIPTNEQEAAGYNIATEMILTETLEWAANTSASEINTGYYLQGSLTNLMGKYLLGRLDNQVATFSFDGDEDTAGWLKLGSKYIASSAAWEYSLDGGKTWTVGADGNGWITEKGIKLTDEEIAQIGVDTDIKVHVQGVPREGNIYTIDITQATVPSTLYGNDLENRVVGVDMTMEWREVTTDENGERHEGEWVSYKESSPQRIGNVTIQVRVGATGTRLPSEASQDFVFTPNTDEEYRKYVAVSHLSIAGVSSQATGGNQNGNAIYAIDGNINTRWHSAWNASDRERWIAIKFDHKVDLSAIEYVPAAGGNGRILQADFYVTASDKPYNELTTEDFVLAGQISNNCDVSEVICQSAWPNVDNSAVRNFEFATKNEDGEWEYQPVKNVTYLVIKGRQTTAATGSFIAAKMFNFYEDRTNKTEPTASVAYSTMTPTNGDVIARLVNPSTEIEVTSTTNTGDPYTYRFTENGEFTFTFRDSNGEVGQAIAKVDWISRAIAAPEVVFTCVNDSGAENVEEVDCGGSRKVNRSVSAKLVFPEGSQIKILNNGFQVEDGDDYEAVAPNPDAGGMGGVESGTSLEGDEMSGDKDSLDPFTYLFMRNGEFTFEYEDAAGNRGSTTVIVHWIDKAAPKVEIEYSPREVTDGEVVARLVKVDREPDLIEDNPDPDTPEIDDDTLNDLLGEGYGGDDDDEMYDENGYQYGEEPIVTNNGGSNEYRFTENGEFVFEYRDEAGNRATAVATVDWIKKSEQPDNPEQPDVPDPDKPEQPDTPDNPEVPNWPEEPDISDYPENPNRPNVPGQTGGNQAGGSQTGNSGWTGGVSSGTGAGDRTEVADNNSGSTSGSSSSGTGGSLTVEAVGLPEGTKVQNRPLILNQAQKNQFGANSELYKLEFVTENGEISEERPTEVTITVKAGKKLEAVYIVKEDGTTEKVEFERVDDTHIVIKNPVPGDYLFDYEDEPKKTDADEAQKEDKDSTADRPWYTRPAWWVLGGIMVVVVAGTGAAMVNNRRR